MPSTAVPRSSGVTTITVLNHKKKYSYRHELLHHHKKNIVYAFNGRSALKRGNNNYCPEQQEKLQLSP
jgi:hypothetical protein